VRESTFEGLSFSLYFVFCKRGVFWLGHEWMIETLAALGLSIMNSKVYLLLEKNGPLTARKMADMLKLPRQQVYRILRRLQKGGLVYSSGNRPTVFSAITFEGALDLFLKEKSYQAKMLSDKRNELLLSWRLMIEKEKN
jgi:sugar-specific transcriptional regulator TrmB